MQYIDTLKTFCNAICFHNTYTQICSPILSVDMTSVIHKGLEKVKIDRKNVRKEIIILYLDDNPIPKPFRYIQHLD